MSERRSVTAPPEMMTGSTGGGASSDSSPRATRLPRQTQEVHPPAATLERPLGLELQDPRDQAVPRIEYQRVQRALRARPVGRGVLGERQLEERVQLRAFAAAAGILKDHAAGADVPGAHKRAVGGGRGRSKAVKVQDAEVPSAQIPTPIGAAEPFVEQASE